MPAESAFEGLCVYLGSSPAAKNAHSGPLLDDGGNLMRQFHKCFLDAPPDATCLKATVQIPELPPVDLQWTSIGHTAGMALWIRHGKIGAASILLNGMEFDEESRVIRAVLASHGLPVPPHVWDRIAQGPRPLSVVLFYDFYHFTDPVLGTAAPALANAYFTLFGTSG
jgi:hypothetical protein